MKTQMHVRPDPDALLSAMKAAESDQKKGRLKVFFGMCAGVGKTYAMLKEAGRLKAEEQDIVVGIIETHGRSETAALAEGLERLPLLPIYHRDVTFDEFNLDAALQRRPGTILVDELAHSNIPGARHPKRYQDVIELLDNGINVYTTLNVQHLESRATTIEEITGIRMRETVPDSILELADEIALIDISEQELLKRLAAGKVYAPEGARRAAQGFFRSGNLTALREMALRVTAEHVDQQMRKYMQSENIPGPWKTSHRLMAALSWSPFSAQLIRWTKRMATTLEASWVAVYVETSSKLSEAQTALLMKNMRLAQELGAEVVTVYHEEVAAGLLQIARQKNVTQIVVGKPGKGRVRRLLSGETLVEKLIRTSGQIDIYVVRSELGVQAPPPFVKRPRFQSNLKQYGLSLSIVLSVTAILHLFPVQINYLSVAMFLLFAVTLLSLKFSRGPVLAAAALSALLWDLLFIPPVYTFTIARVEDVLILCMYFLIAMVTGTLTAEIRRKEEIVRLREMRAVALYNMSRELAAADSVDVIARIAVEQIGQIFDADVALFLLADEKLQLHKSSRWQADEKEKSVALWVTQNRKPAGKFTDNLPHAQGRHEPLITPRNVYGIVGIHFHRENIFTLDQESLLENFCRQIAAAIERERFSEQRHRVELADASEKLYQTLLNSISHEFRTPLSVISGAIDSLADPALALPAPSRQDLLIEIRGAANRLNTLVENLLNMSRLESGRIRPKMEWCDVGDIFSALYRRHEQESPGHPLEFTIMTDMPLILTDPGLLEQALGNIIQNAMQYTPADRKVEVHAHLADSVLHIAVQDHGPGIPGDALPHLFEKFYRVAGSSSGGTGLGLSISKGIIESLEGSISAANVAAGGTRFLVRLPMATMNPILKAQDDESD